MKIKVCGINDAVFAAEAARLGVDYLGFIFEPSSPRFVTPEKARSICSSLEQRHKALDSSASLGTRFARLGRFPMGRAHPQGADTRLCVENKPVLVGVFVRETPAEIIATMRRVGLDVVQLHRRATGEDVAALKHAGYEVWTLAGGAEGDGVLFDWATECSSTRRTATEIRRSGPAASSRYSPGALVSKTSPRLLRSSRTL